MQRKTEVFSTSHREISNKLGGAQTDFIEQRDALFLRNLIGFQQMEDDICEDFDGRSARQVDYGFYGVARRGRKGRSSERDDGGAANHSHQNTREMSRTGKESVRIE